MKKGYSKPEKRILIGLGNNVRKTRNDKGLSQESLASIAGLDRTYVGGIERGERNISILNIMKIAEALDVPVTDLLKDL